MWWPAGRKWALYLVPAIIGTLAKQPALVFMPLLFVYVYLFESEQQAGRNGVAGRLRYALRASMPAAVACIGLGLLQLAMTPSTFAPGAASRYDYWLTQPTVILHYIESFFLPLGLSADTDRSAVTSMLSETFVFNATLLILLVWLVRRPLRRPEMRPAAFGVWWFVIAVLPAAIQPLAELDNDHRMFFPFVGLVLAATWMAYQALLPSLERGAAPVVVAAALLLVACGIGTYNRNEVWHNDESLWKDVTEKSPHNGRGLMNYGLVLMARGNYGGALELYKKAEQYTPNYSVLKVNEGIVYGAVGNDADAEAHFRTAMVLDPTSTSSYYFFARWLNQKERLPEAAALLQRAIEFSSSDMDSRYLLMQVYSKQGADSALHALAADTLARFPGDPTAAAFLNGAATPAQSGAARLQPETPEEFLNLSLVYEQSGKHEECIAAARQALKLRPDYAEAYNNIAAAYESMGRWDDAIAAAEQALRLKPDMQLARNNLQAALNQKKRHAGSGS
jgi:tetratricopeptide (TPR) repeat protein